MKYGFDKAKVRKVDSTLSITDLFDGKGFSFDLVIASLDGDHPTVINRKSDRVYLILSGNGNVKVNNQTYDVRPLDLVTIKANEPHSIHGVLRYVIITSPPFNPFDEQ